MMSAIAWTSLSLCEMKMIDRPPARSSRMIRNRSSVSPGVSTAVGSSRTSTLASRSSALMISTRCCTPTGRSSTQGVGVDPQAEPLGQLEHLAARAPVAPVEQAEAGSRRAGPPAHRLAAERDVLGDGEDRHQHEVLVHHADPGADRVLGRADARPACRRPGSRPRRAGSARTGRSSAWSCPRRSRRAGRGSRRAATTRSMWSLATRLPKRLVMPRSSSFTGASTLAQAMSPVSCPAAAAGGTEPALAGHGCRCR